MYLYETHTGKEAQEFVSRPLPSGGDWTEMARQVQKVEVWASSMDDPGADHHVLVAFDVDGCEISRKRVRGY
jgi:hypothetical protein